ncbi:MarR family winged helix-turn-helix transcriptional regulator [Azotosporobacter soli]|uniref:MarR family winged helix-turn-helix transcriptional regulator n=1 Tax=Azotosporobacter soli TaxID=3055040 RepID=UPI0031FF0123
MENEEQMGARRLREGTRQLVRGLGVLEKSEAGCCELSLGQCHAIIEIGRSGEMSLMQLALVLNLDKSTVSRLVDKLVQEGLIDRQENSADRRYSSLILTEAGRAVFQSVETKMGDHFMEVLAALPQEKRMQIVESIELLGNAVSTIRNRETKNKREVR